MLYVHVKMYGITILKLNYVCTFIAVYKTSKLLNVFWITGTHNVYKIIEVFMDIFKIHKLQLICCNTLLIKFMASWAILSCSVTICTCICNNYRTHLHVFWHPTNYMSHVFTPQRVSVTNIVHAPLSPVNRN